MTGVLGWWDGLPVAFREQAKSAAVAVGLSLQTVFFTLLGAAITTGHFSSPEAFVAFCFSNYWVMGIGPVLAALYRTRQARIAVANTVPITGGGTAVITTAPKG